jgi:hypothetical protein
MVQTLKKSAAGSFAVPSRMFSSELLNVPVASRGYVVAKENATLKVVREERRRNRPKEPKSIEEIHFDGILLAYFIN